MILAVLIAGILHPATTLDHDGYDWCNANLGLGEAYCCQQDGGYWKYGICYDNYESSPDYVPPATITITQRPRP